jgi:hypothetical protein
VTGIENVKCAAIPAVVSVPLSCGCGCSVENEYSLYAPSISCKHRQGAKEDGLKNVDMKVEGNILTIKVDLSKEFGPSASGKTIIIASTEGNVSVTDRDEKVGLNVYRKK